MSDKLLSARLKRPWDDVLAEEKGKETGFDAKEVLWLLGILYKHHKAKSRAKEVLANVLKVCKEANIESLYSIYGTLVEGGIVKKKDIEPAYRQKMEEQKRVKEHPNITDNDWFKGFM